MADSIIDGLKNELEDKLEDKINPEKVFSEGNLKKKRGAFWTCFLAALLLVALALGASLYWNGTKVSLLEQGIVNNVDLQGLGISEDSAKSFAVTTLAYLQGTVENWEPVLVVGDHVLNIPQAFKDHMATVKGWVSAATAVLLAGAAIVLLLLGRAMIGSKNGRKGSFSLGGYYLGALIPLALLVGVGAWAYFDFNGFWQLLHKTLIPDGIFDAGEEIMQLFPSALFLSYLKPVAITFGILAAIILALPLVLKPLSLLLTRLFGKRTPTRRTGSRRRSSTRRRTASRKKSSSASAR